MRLPSDTLSQAGPAAEDLARSIGDHTTVVGVVGLGYVGLPLAHTFHAAGFPVLGFDLDEEKVDALARGRNYLDEKSAPLVADLTAGARFEATTDMARLGEADAVIICVPTPLGPHREPDLGHVEASGRLVGATLRPGQLVVLESTTFPGTTRGELARAIESSAPPGLLGRHAFLAYSPEREDPGRRDHTTATIPKLVGGVDAASTELAARLYGEAVEQVVTVESAEIAEASKLLENIFRAVNIALVNEMKVVLDDLGIDVWKVIDAAATKPFGFMPFRPGPGLGGHCIPIDPFYLAWKAREVGRDMRFVELAGTVNTAMPAYVVERVAGALNDRHQSVRGSRVLVLGLAYKPDVGDTRESPAAELISRLQSLGAHVDYSDPHVPVAPPMRRAELAMKSRELTDEVVASYDCVLVATDHRAFDWDMVARAARLVVDTRNALAAHATELGDRLVKA
jgi:UDP-N-acetyl-D-glucosamine dehydrogenase